MLLMEMLSFGLCDQVNKVLIKSLPTSIVLVLSYTSVNVIIFTQLKSHNIKRLPLDYICTIY